MTTESLRMLRKSLKNLMEVLDSHEECIIGYLDETSPQLNANSQRLWSFNKLEKRECMRISGGGKGGEF